MISRAKNLIIAASAILMLGGYSTAQAQCFDLSQFGTDPYIVPIDMRADYVEEKKPIVNPAHPETPDTLRYQVFTWTENVAAAGHPAQTLMMTAGKDELCPKLNVLTPDGAPTIRLAAPEYKEGEHSQGQTIAMGYLVTAENPIVKFQYAGTFEVSDHEISQNEKGDEKYFSQAYMRYFLQTTGEGAAIVPNSTIEHFPTLHPELGEEFTNERGKKSVFMDWRNAYYDLSDYVGKRVYVIATSYDCLEEDIVHTTLRDTFTFCDTHESARVYCGVQCGPKQIVAEHDCNLSTKTKLTAPECGGYRWYLRGEPSKTLSTEQVLEVETPWNEDQTYYCELTCLLKNSTVEYTISGTRADTIIREVEFGESFTWSVTKKTYTTPGLYTDTTWVSKDGVCHAIMHTLDFRMKADYCIGKVEMVTDTVCADAGQVVLHANYTRGSINKYDITFSEAAKKAGLEDIKGATEIKENGDIVIELPYETGKYVRPDTYTLTMTSYTSCEEVKDTVLRFTVLYPAEVIYQRWKDVLFVQNEDYNGGYKISHVVWYKNGVRMDGRGEHGAYLYELPALDGTAEYWAELTREDDKKTLCTCRTRANADNSDSEMPTFVSALTIEKVAGNGHRIEVKSMLSGKYALYNIQGKSIKTGVFSINHKSEEINVPSPGVYVMLLNAEDGTTEVKKFVMD